MSATVHIGFLGCGNIGCGVWRLLRDMGPEMEKRSGLSFEVKKILVRDLGKQRGIDAPSELFTDRPEDVIGNPDISVVLEFLGGDEPAHSYVVQALRSGQTVVTANKMAFALHFEEYLRVAAEHGSNLYFEAAVCGAIPIIHALEGSLQANRVDSLYGIVNGTTNYILTRMTQEGAEYADVLRDAQRLGLAEPDPTADVEGLDAAYKLSILSSLAFHGHIPFEKVFTEGISRVQAEDIRIAGEMGYTVKLLAIAKNQDGVVQARVHPTLIPKDHPLASVNGSFNAVFLHGHACGDMMFMGRGAGDLPTASAIVSDLERAARRMMAGTVWVNEDGKKETSRTVSDDWECPFYVRLSVPDQPGVLGRVALVFAEVGISIESMRQTNARDGRATLVFITHTARESAAQKAIAFLPPDNVRVEAVLRIEA